MTHLTVQLAQGTSQDYHRKWRLYQNYSSLLGSGKIFSLLLTHNLNNTGKIDPLQQIRNEWGALAHFLFCCKEKIMSYGNLDKSPIHYTCIFALQFKQVQLRLCKLGPSTVLIFYKLFAPILIYMKRFALVVFAWKCRLFFMSAHVQCRVHYIYHVEFYFRFGHLITFPV